MSIGLETIRLVRDLALVLSLSRNIIVIALLELRDYERSAH